MREYNYASFPEDMEMEDFARFRDGLRVGSRAPDGELTEAFSGEKVRLSDYWRRGHLVMEFGSIT